MTQDQVITLCLKIFLITGFCSLITWITVYTRLAPWWRDPLGRTLVAKSALIAGLFVPAALGLFFRFSPLTSRIAAWINVAFIALVTPVMLWRTAVWRRAARQAGKVPE